MDQDENSVVIFSESWAYRPQIPKVRLFEQREGRTGFSGQLLVPYLTAYHAEIRCMLF